MSSDGFKELRELKFALASGQGIEQRISEYFQGATVAPPEARNEMLAALDELVAASPVDVAGRLAILAGAIVERGGEPRAFPGAVFDHLLAQLRTITGPDDERELPEGYDLLERAAMACLSRSFELRAALPQKPALLDAIVRYRERYSFLGKMLRVLDGESMLVLHPSTGRGFRVRISGISDNFELHSLLLRTFAGDGPQQIPGTVPPSSGSASSDWQLAGWRALLPDRTLDKANYNRDWIWNEGLPAEIPPFEGTRTILIGPSTIQRSWNVGRMFSGMEGTLHVEATLPGPEVDALLARIDRARLVS